MARDAYLVLFKNMVDVALFELEGVLFDTADLRRAGLRDSLAAHGIVLVLDADVIGGLPPRAAAVAALERAHIERDAVTIDLIALRAERAFSERLATGGVTLRPGALAFLENAAGQARLGIVARGFRSDAQAMLRLAELENVAAIMVCADDVLDPKPAPECYQEALTRLGRKSGSDVNPASVVALEDGLFGVRAAHGVGIRCVAVGPLPPHVAIEADAYVVSLEGQTLKSLDALSAPGREQVQ